MDTTRTKSRIIQEMTQTLEDLKKVGVINDEQLVSFVKLESLEVKTEKEEGN
jgi:phenylacetate-coenzyme A ligase PaaK-like adenylate-forming protein